MLRKFKGFFEPVPEYNLSFEPFVKIISGLQLQVMKANDSHLDDLLNLERRVYHGHTPWDRFSFKNELRHHHDSLYLVVYDGSSLVAFIGTRFSVEDSHITNIAVSPEYQRRGIASFLIQMMIEYGRQNHSEQMSLEVRTDNKSAQAAYENLGFRPKEIHKNYYFTDHVDGLSMVLDLKSNNKN